MDREGFEPPNQKGKRLQRSEFDHFSVPIQNTNMI